MTSNFLLKAGVIALVLYLMKTGTSTGAKAFDRIVNWGRGVVTESNLSTFSRQLRNDYNFSGNFPQDFPAWVRESVRNNSGDDPALDFWGTLYQLERNRAGIRGAFEIRSCGPDKECPSRDDIAVQGTASSEL